MLNISREELIKEIRIRYSNKTNQEYLARQLRYIRGISEDKWQELLERYNIQNVVDIYMYVEEYLNKLSPTRIGPPDGRYLKRIHEDPQLIEIMEGAKEIEEPTEEKISYYIAYKLALILAEDPERFFVPDSIKIPRYNDPVNLEGKGICKSIAELYADMLSEFGIKAELVRKQLDRPEYSHVDVVVICKRRTIFVNEIANIYRVQTNRMMNNFGSIILDISYRLRIEEVYGRLGYIPEETIKQFDEELGLVQKRDKDGKAIYFNDEITEYLSLLKRKRARQTPEQNKMELSEDVRNYMRFVFEHESFTGNNHFSEKSAHYTNCMAKCIKELNLRGDNGLELGREVCIVNGDLNNLVALWVLNDKITGQKDYYIFGDKFSMRETDGLELFKMLNTGEAKVADTNTKKALSPERQDEVIEMYFPQYLLDPERISKETGDEQRDTTLKGIITQKISEMVAMYKEWKAKFLVKDDNSRD